MNYKQKMQMCLDSTRLCDYCPLYNVCGTQITDSTADLARCGCALAEANATENNFLAWWSEEEQETYAHEHHENTKRMHRNAVRHLLEALYNGEHKKAEEVTGMLVHWILCNNVA